MVETVIIEHLQLVGDDEWNVVEAQTFPEHYQSPYASVTILKRMYRFEPLMKVKNILKCRMLPAIVIFQKFPHLPADILGRCGLVAAYFVWEPFVITYVEPFLALVRCSRFQQVMKAFDETLGEFAVGFFNEMVYGPEMICGFDDIVNIHYPVCKTDCVCFKNVAGLIVGQPAPFYMI